MDLSFLSALYSVLDPTLLKGGITVLALLVVLSIVKKAVKLAVFIAIVAIGVSFLLPVARELREKYSISMDGEQLVMVVDGQTIRIGGDADLIRDMTLAKNTDGAYIVTVVYGSPGGKTSFEIPPFMRWAFQAYIDRNYGSEKEAQDPIPDLP